MKILVINSGSSSIKLQLLEMKGETALASCLVERIGEEIGLCRCVFRKGSAAEQAIERRQAIANHREGMRLALSILTDAQQAVLVNHDELVAVGHRVVHGGEDFHQPCLIDDAVIQAIEAVAPLAPLHNPANLDGIRVAMELLPGLPQVAVFDTAFHQTMPPHAYHYALPRRLYLENRVRRYGFHGTSHQYVAGECARLMAKPLDETNLITAHLGNGSSMTAIEKGKSIDTTLGLTPLEGLIMGTRCGDIDPSIHAFLARVRGMDIAEIDAMLNKESGLKGICGLNDMRDIHAAVEQGDADAALALDMLTYRNRRYIGAYMAVLGRVDAIVFTAGIGENDAVVREKSLAGLENFGIVLDPEKNRGRQSGAREIGAAASKTRLWVIPTNEELAIARQTLALTGDGEKGGGGKSVD
ncbi:MAG: acetate kinase [Desulfobulbaceae bacterium]|jgi:acetate kinase|nr:acetate kinase [Desulfobulbaceae bacterium]